MLTLKERGLSGHAWLPLEVVCYIYFSYHALSMGLGLLSYMLRSLALALRNLSSVSLGFHAGFTFWIESN